MGRIADALARAERLRSGTTPERVPPTVATPRWGNWYGSARTHLTAALPTTVEHAQALHSPKDLAEELVCFHDRSSIVSEQYRSLRTGLLSSNPQQEHRVYAVSSALPKEGKSVTVANLGLSFAEIRHLRILLVDGDFRHSSLAALFGISQEPGLADLLLENATHDQVIRRTLEPNLYVVTAGRSQGRPAPELLSTPAAKTAFQRFEKEFHYTLVDTPPATTVTDVGIIGQMTAGVIFVFRIHRTPEPLARRALKYLAANHIPVIGGLIIAETGSGSGYGTQYKYYRYDSQDT